MRAVFVLCLGMWVFAGCGSKARDAQKSAEPTDVSTRLDPDRRYIRDFEKDRKRLTDPSLRIRYNLTPTEERKLRREIEKKEPAPATTD